MRNRESLGGLAITVVVSVLLVAWLFDLASGHLYVPLQYGAGGEVLVECAWIKTIAEQGWYLRNPRLGAPGEQHFHDFPLADSLHFGLMRVLLWVWPDWGTVMNAYFILGFPLAAALAFITFHALRVSYPAAVLSAVLFAFLPYHLFRGQAHMQLASYYMVPPAVLLALWLHQDVAFYRSAPFRLTRHGAWAGAVGFVLGSSGVYYSFFTLYLLGVAALPGFPRRLFWSRVRHALIPAAAILLSLTLNFAPSLIHMHRHGANHEVAARVPFESELYGLKLIQLLLPVQHHRAPLLRDFRAAYDRTSLLVNENSGSSLGILGAFGFAFLLASLFLRLPHGPHSDLLDALSRLNLAAVLLGTVGGLGTLLAWLVTPKIRAYNRISVFIAFFSLTVIAILADRFWKSAVRVRMGKAIASLALIATLGVGVWDQTPLTAWPTRQKSIEDYLRDAAFFGRLEASLPRGASVVQIPHMSYPESPPIHHLRDYEHFRAYLHTRTLRFSYGAMRGRYWDGWLHDALSKHRLGDSLEALAAVGFHALLVDGYGYADGAAQIEADLRSRLGDPVLVSSDGRYACYQLWRLVEELREKYPADSWFKVRDYVRSSPLVRWVGFYGSEGTGKDTWRWCTWRGEIHIDNPVPRPQVIAFDAELLAGSEKGCLLTVEGLGFAESYRLDPVIPVVLSRRLTLPPGRSVLRFKATGPELRAPGDPRSLVFRIIRPQFGLVSPGVTTVPNPLLGPRIVFAN